MKFSIINMAWVIINLPFIAVVILLLSTAALSEMIALTFILAVLTPLLLFPSTTALFAIAREWLLEPEQTALIKRYWKLIKENYGKSFSGGLIFSVIWLIWFLDYRFLASVNNFLGIVMLIAGVLLFVVTVMFFCFHAHYHMTLKKMVYNALLVTGGSPLILLGIILLSGSLFYFSLHFLFMFAFFTMSLFAYLSFYLFYRYTLKIRRLSTT